MPSASPGVLFDLDGTLVDSNYLHVIAWARAFDEAGERISMAAIHRMIGVGSPILLRELLGDDRRDLADAHGRHFDRLKPELRPFPHARELLEDVARRGARVVLATSSREADVAALVDAVGAGDAVTAVTHGGDVEEAKPDPDVLETAMEKGGLDRERTILVGDTPWDVEAARRAGIPCVCVLSGGIGRAELEEAGAEAVYDDVAALRSAIDDSPLAKVLPR
ncbi:MAG: HAD family hydrolase [Actinomycetota bacterium]|nr:HAD family hydrolase [Actinomycetota bacterium]